VNQISPYSEFITVDEIATTLRLSRMTIYRLLANGQLGHIRIGRNFRIPRSAFEEYLRVHSAGMAEE
jgi:excisionase family DNA binding protein